VAGQPDIFSDTQVEISPHLFRVRYRLVGYCFCHECNRFPASIISFWPQFYKPVGPRVNLWRGRGRRTGNRDFVVPLGKEFSAAGDRFNARRRCVALSESLLGVSWFEQSVGIRALTQLTPIYVM
jgi:hypothetical protein